jgi:hypothetical protein
MQSAGLRCLKWEKGRSLRAEGSGKKCDGARLHDRYGAVGVVQIAVCYGPPVASDRHGRDLGDGR